MFNEDDPSITAIIEDTMEDQIPRIEMIMAMALSKRAGKLVDMKLDKSACKSCEIQTEPHVHMTGTIR